MPEAEVGVGQLLLEKGYTIACAESCTGGLLTSCLTDVAGSSAYVKGSVVSYTNEVKHGVLGVSQKLLDTVGAVSSEVAAEMAEGVRRVIGSDIGVSVTGLAGPGGGTAEKPVGLVFIGISDSSGTNVIKCIFKGSRVEVKQQAAQRALQLIAEYING